MSEKILIVGGVGGGATVAAQIRRKDKESEIVMFEKTEYVSFANCGMPYYIGGVVDDRDKLLYDPEDFAEDFQIDVRTDSEVTQINPQEKTILYQYNNKILEEKYDKLILSQGAQAAFPPIAGIKNERTFTLHNIPDMDMIHAYIEQHQPKHATVIGGGFIGLEVVENLREIDINCTLIDRSNHVLHRLIDPEFGEIVEKSIIENEVELLLQEGLLKMENDGRKLTLASGRTLETDMTIIAVGIKPSVDLAVGAGLAIGETTNAIHVNEYMQTSDQAIYALGDAVESTDFLTNKPTHIALAWPAHRQAAVIADHLAGGKATMGGLQGSSILKVFDLTVAVTGHNHQSLTEAGIDFKEVSTQSTSHAAYYPGAEKLWLKIYYDAKDGTLYGGTVVGHKGADKRMAVLATAIKGKLTVEDLTELELGYAPPYSHTKDPINILGYKASNR